MPALVHLPSLSLTSIISSSEHPLYKWFKCTLLSLCGIDGDELHNTIHASPADGHKPACFDMVVLIEDMGLTETIGVKGVLAIAFLSKSLF